MITQAIKNLAKQGQQVTLVSSDGKSVKVRIDHAFKNELIPVMLDIETDDSEEEIREKTDGEQVPIPLVNKTLLEKVIKLTKLRDKPIDISGDLAIDPYFYEFYYVADYLNNKEILEHMYDWKQTIQNAEEIVISGIEQGNYDVEDFEHYLNNIKKFYKATNPELISGMLGDAIDYDLTEVVHMLLEKGADPNYRFESGPLPPNPLGFTVSEDGVANYEIAKLLISYGANIEDVPFEVFYEALKNDKDMAKKMLKAIEESNQKKRFDFYDPQVYEELLEEERDELDSKTFKTLNYLKDEKFDKARKLY